MREQLHSYPRPAFWRGFLLVVSLAACSPDAVTRPYPTGAPNAAVGQERQTFIVQLAPTVQDPPVIAAALMRQYGGELRRVYRHALKGFSAEMTQSAADALMNSPMVDMVELPTGVARVFDTQTPVIWGLDRIDQRALPLSNSYTYPASAGAGVHVYVIDTGIRRSHQEFGGRAFFMASFVPDDGWNGDDCYGHGTHVSGTIGGVTVGVAKSVQLHDVRVLDCGGSGAWDGVIAAMDLVAGTAIHPCVVNMSIGGGKVQSVNDAVQGLLDAGCTVAVAAGNSSGDACLLSPASAPNALTVMASRVSDYRASFSSLGPCADLYAPGVDIYSAFSNDPNHSPDTDGRCDTCYATWSGTSMATPHVAGAAALLLGVDPSLTPASVNAAILAGATPGVIQSNPSGTSNLLLFTGTGAPPPPPEPPPPSAGFLKSCAGYSCTFTAINDGSWTFGDGGTATGVQVTHLFAPKAHYTVTHTVAGNPVPVAVSVNCRPKGRCQ